MEENLIEKLKEEVRREAENLKTEIDTAIQNQTEAYNLPWGMGHAYVEESRDRANDKLYAARKKTLTFGEGIWDKYSQISISQCRELVDIYVEVIKEHISEDEISEIKNYVWGLKNDGKTNRKSYR